MSNSGNRRGGSQSDVDTSRAISNQKKYHYPTIAELVGSEASLDSVCSNLKKEDALCLLREAITQLREKNATLNALTSAFNNLSKPDNQLPQSEVSCNNNPSVNFDSLFRKSLEERDHDIVASKSVVFYNVEENQDDNKTVSDLMTKLKIPQNFVKRSTRLGRKSTVVNPPPRPRPIEVLFDCEHDKRLLMANAYLLKNSHVFVKPKLKWSDRQKEKSLLKLRYDLIQSGFDRKFFRIRDLKLFYSGTEINDNEPFDSISGFLGTIDTNNDENKD